MFLPLSQLKHAFPSSTSQNLFTVTGDAEIAAVKKAEGGEGIIVRLRRFSDETKTVRLQCTSGSLAKVLLCNALEQTLRELSTSEKEVVVELDGYLTTLNVRIGSPFLE